MSAGECNSAHSVTGFLEIRVIRVQGIKFDSYQHQKGRYRMYSKVGNFAGWKDGGFS